MLKSTPDHNPELKLGAKFGSTLSAALITAAILIGTGLPALAGVIEDRKANFKANNGHMRAIGGAIGSGDFDLIKSRAGKIAEWAAVMPDYFPEGSLGSDSSAKPEIWEAFDEFKAAAQDNHDAAMAVIAAAEAKNGDDVGAALQALGASCKACHQKFKGW
jgi:cytochrome c556